MATEMLAKTKMLRKCVSPHNNKTKYKYDEKRRWLTRSVNKLKTVVKIWFLEKKWFLKNQKMLSGGQNFIKNRRFL
jgi:hypothetical protein